MKQLISSFIFSRLDYCNALLIGLPFSTIVLCNVSRTPPHVYYWDCRGVTTASPEGATVAARRVQNPVQAGTGDVHNPHTPQPRLPHLCRRVTVIRHGLVSARRQAATTLFHGQERDLATEPSLWPVQLYGTVYQQQFVKLTACIRLGASSKHICLLYVLMTD